MAKKHFAIERPRKINISIEGYDPQARTLAQKRSREERARRVRRRADAAAARAIQKNDEEIEALNRAAATQPQDDHLGDRLEENCLRYSPGRRVAMHMTEPSYWQVTGGANVFDELVASGHVVELTHLAPQWLRGHPIAIEATVFDRLITWDAQAQQRHGLVLDESTRVEHLFEACGIAACGAGGCFICKAVDAQGRTGCIERHLLTMTNCGRASEPSWLIHS
jgi:hypothetical protein